MINKVFLQRRGGKAKAVELHGRVAIDVKLDPFDGMARIAIANRGYSGIVGIYKGLERANAVVRDFRHALSLRGGSYAFPDV